MNGDREFLANEPQRFANHLDPLGDHKYCPGPVGQPAIAD